MGNSLNLLAVDLGGESGRAMLGRFDGDRIVLEELHRFANEPVELPTGLHWDAPRLFREIVRTLEIASPRRIGLSSAGVDSWGVDYGLLDREGALLGLPFHYRDRRTEAAVAAVHERITPEELFRTTGCRSMRINTIYQLAAQQLSPAFACAEAMLLIPDLMAYWLTGERGAEQTIASTTQLYDAGSGDWASGVIDRLELPRHLFQPIQPPGSVRGRLRIGVAAEAGVNTDLPVIAVGSHDTASAFASVTSGNASLFISSGTWALVGIETEAPIVTEAAMAGGLSNEAGVAGTTRFLRNAAGMWLLQECRRAWRREGRDYGYDELVALAAAAAPLTTLIDPDDPDFVSPGDMPSRIRAHCASTGQSPPESAGGVVRAILESVALNFRAILGEICRVSGQQLEVIHLIGGGARNELHCQLTADACGLPVIAGPVEATALGNAMVQAMALGAVSSLAEIREVIRRSVDHRHYEPTRDRATWDEAYTRFMRLRESDS